MSGEDKKDLAKLVAEEVEKQRKEEKKKADEQKRKSKEGQNKRKRANENWPSYGTLSAASAPSPSGFTREPSLPLPEGMFPQWAEEYAVATRSRQRQLFDAWAPYVNRWPVPQGLLSSFWDSWVLTTDPRVYTQIMADSLAAQTPPPAPLVTFGSAPQQSYPPTQPRNPQRGGRGGYGAGRYNPRFAGQSAQDIADARKRQQALSGNQGGAPPPPPLPLTPSFNISTGPAVEKPIEKEEEEDEPKRKRTRGRGKGPKGDKPVEKPVEKPTEEVAPKPAEGVAAAGVVKGEEDSSMTDVPAPSANERAVAEAATLRSRVSALEQDLQQRGNEASQRDTEMLRLRLDLSNQKRLVTTAEQRASWLQETVNTSRQATQQAEQRVQEANDRAQKARELADRTLQAQDDAERSSALALQREETRRRVQLRLSSALIDPLREMSRLLFDRVEATQSGADTQLQDALIGNLRVMIDLLTDTQTEAMNQLEDKLLATTDAAGFAELLSSVDQEIRKIVDQRSAADDDSRARCAPALPSQGYVVTDADRMAMDEASQAPLPEADDDEL